MSAREITAVAAQKPGRQRVDRIPLIGGGHALVDACDARLAREYQWRRGGSKNHYVVSFVRNGKSIKTYYLHRIVMGAGAGEIIDHINGDGLDCRRTNLRYVTGSENSANRAFTTNENGFRGVSFHPAQNKYQARIERKGIFRGPFRASAEEAAHDADQLLRALYGDVATYNFPRENERGIRRPTAT